MVVDATRGASWAALGLFAVCAAGAVGSARATPLYYIIENCTGCSPVTANGLNSAAPISLMPQIVARSTTDGGLILEQSSAFAGRWTAGALAEGQVSVATQALQAGPVTAAALFALQIPVTPPAGVTSGSFDVSLNFVISGEVSTPSAIFPSSAQVVLAARSVLAVNTDPVDLLSSINTLGFGALTDVGNYHSFGDGTSFGDGVFASVTPTSTIFANGTTPTITAHVGDILTVGLAVFSQVSETSFLPGFHGVGADLLHTITLPTDRPVFNLPDGYTVNSDDGAIVDNVFVAPVPLPASLPLLLVAVGGFGAFLRRKQRA